MIAANYILYTPVKLFSILIFILIIPNELICQKAHTVHDAISNPEQKIVWYGLDFSHFKLIGNSEGFSNPGRIKNRYFKEWNSIILQEKNKFHFEKSFKKKYVRFDTAAVSKSNSYIDPYKMNEYKPVSLSKEDVCEIIGELDCNSEEDEIGLIFIMESFNGQSAFSSMYITFFDINTKKILVAEKMTGRAGGTGIRNYWANSIYNIFVQLYEEKYRKWESNVSGLEGHVMDCLGKGSKYKDVSLTELKKMLEEAIKKEDFKLAAIIKEEIKEREKKKKETELEEPEEDEFFD